MREVGRRFPDYGWAWPRGDLDRLLKAALLADEAAALAEAVAWLAANDIDDVTFREQRLLTAIADRFGRRLAASPAFPRLVGLQRHLWSRSRLALHEAREALAALVDAGIGCMLIKGASRIALAPEAQRGRVSHDIDLLVRPRHMRAAFAALLDMGWQAASGASAMRLVAHAETYRAMNFFRGRHGDLDVHQKAYHPVQASLRDDEDLWRRAVEATLDGVAVSVPSAGDRIAIAIAHGGLDAHAHSDWLVDIHRAVEDGGVDWAALEATLAVRRLLVPSAAALTYLAQEIGTPVPAPVLAGLVERADAEGMLRRLAILESKPRTDFGRLSGAARGIAKQMRLWSGRREAAPPPQTVWRARLARPAGHDGGKAPATGIAIPVERRAGTLELTLLVDLPPARRRVELELSTSTRLLATLRYRKLTASPGLRRLVFRGPLQLDAGEEVLRLEARPSRFSPHWTTPEEAARYAAVPFALVGARFR